MQTIEAHRCCHWWHRSVHIQSTASCSDSSSFLSLSATATATERTTKGRAGWRWRRRSTKGLIILIILFTCPPSVVVVVSFLLEGKFGTHALPLLLLFSPCSITIDTMRIYQSSSSLRFSCLFFLLCTANRRIIVDCFHSRNRISTNVISSKHRDDARRNNRRVT